MIYCHVQVATQPGEKEQIKSQDKFTYSLLRVTFQLLTLGE